MRIYNHYIVTIATLLLLTTVVLAAIGQNSLGTYYTAYLVLALIVTELFVAFNAKARKGLHLVSIVLLAGFLIVLGLHVIRILI